MSMNLSYLPGKTDSYLTMVDRDYERAEALEAAREAAMEQRLADLGEVKFSQASEVMSEAMMLIADDEQQQEMFNRWLFQAWQNRNCDGDKSRRMMRDHAVSLILTIMNDAINLAVENEFKQRH